MEDVCHGGGISEKRYDVFVNALAAPGKGFVIEMECRTVIAEPVYDQGIFTGKTWEYESVCRTDEILDSLHSDGECAFDKGAVFSLSLRRNDNVTHISGTITGNR